MITNKSLQLIGVEPEDLINAITSQVTANVTALLNEKINPAKQNEIMTRKEVSELLQKDYSTLYRWKEKGVLLPTFIDGSIYYYRSDIDTLLEKNKGV